MMVADASALISLIAGEVGADEVEELLEQPDAAVTSLNLAEVIDHMERVEGYPPDDVIEAVNALVDAGLAVLPVQDEDGRLAGDLRARHYHARQCPLSMADCVLLAVAVNRGATLATSDGALANVARRLSVKVVALPNSAGRLP